ncbi:MAG: minichromosome maintenance protein MCM [Candidatus Bathyarchaeia archaeon]
MVSIQESHEEKLIDFLKSFKDENGDYKYRKKLSLMALTGQRSLVVDFDDLIVFDPELSRRVVSDPDDFFEPLQKAALTQLAMEDPEYAEQVKKVFVRFRRIPEKLSLRRVGAEHLNRLVLIDGIVVRSTPVKPTIVKAAFQCRSCNETILVEQKGQLMRGASVCPSCKGRLLDLDIKNSIFMNSQELRIQERPEDLPPGQLPRAIDVISVEDLVDVARPGDRVSVTGVLRALQEISGKGARLRTFELLLEANYIDIPSREAEVLEITPEEEDQIKLLAKDPWINRKLIQSLAPSIYGYQHIKEAILYLLFGGVRKTLPDGVTIRGDINVLLVGDPGTAKSALLQYTSRIAPRGLYTSGRGSTAAGLTAAVLREKTGGMVLEAGALVLADKGVASIDEIDKMRPEDRVAIL